MESYRIKVLGGDEINDLISDLLEIALEMPKDSDIHPLIRLAQILHEAQYIEEKPSKEN